MAPVTCRWCGWQPSFRDKFDLTALAIVNSNGKVQWGPVLDDHLRHCPVRAELAAEEKWRRSEERRRRTEERAERDAERALARRNQRR